MGVVLENALMAVTRLDVVSNHSGLAIIITAIAYRVEMNLFSSGRCNGTRECTDGSDESNCCKL